MTDDNIVERLRLYGWRLNASGITVQGLLMHEAADEIERLRAGGCARNQTTTQFCAEAEQLRDRCNRLLHQLQEFEAREAQ